MNGTKELLVRIVTDLSPGETEERLGKLLRSEPYFLAIDVSMAEVPGTFTYRDPARWRPIDTNLVKP